MFHKHVLHAIKSIHIIPKYIRRSNNMITSGQEPKNKSLIRFMQYTTGCMIFGTNTYNFLHGSGVCERGRVGILKAPQEKYYAIRNPTRDINYDLKIFMIIMLKSGIYGFLWFVPYIQIFFDHNAPFYPCWSQKMT